MGFKKGDMTQKPGYNPAGQFADSDQPFGLKLGIITHVDEVTMKADVRILTGSGDRKEIDLTQSLAGPRSFWGGVPEVNSLVVLGYRRVNHKLYNAMILGFLPVGHRSGVRFDPMATVAPSEIDPEDAVQAADIFGPTIRYKRLKLSSGDVGGMSSSGSEFTLTTDVSMVNRAGDLFELRDSERTLVSQAIHRVEVASGVHVISGPIRRGDFWLPPDLFQKDGTTLRTTDDRYFGADYLKAAGLPNSRFADSSGAILDIFNDANEFPPTTYSNGRRVYFPTNRVATAFESNDGLGSSVFVEHRTEIAHDSDLAQEVMSEIDGFNMSRRQPYIESVMGTLVGNDIFNSTDGQRHYGRVLRPFIFESFWQSTGGVLRLEEVDRGPQKPDVEPGTVAGAFLFRMRSPSPPNAEFAAAVNKQGQLFLSVPGGSVSKYADGSKNVSAEMAFGGAVKILMGASNPDKVSLNLTAAGGALLDLGADTSGNSLTIKHVGAIKFVRSGTTRDDNGVGFAMEVDGDHSVTCATAKQQMASGDIKCDGRHTLQADRVATHAFSGYTLNAGEVNQMVSGKSQFNYAMQVLKNIALGGELTTILAGGIVENILAGAVSQTVSGGAKSTSVLAGAYSVSVGTGAMSLSTDLGVVSISTSVGAMSISASVGPITMSGLAISMTATTLLSMEAPLILIGGAAAVLGSCRGTPMMPPGSPSLDWITGLPLQGAATVLSM